MYLNRLKKKLYNLPFPYGKAISYIPYSLRPGAGYPYFKRKRDINRIQQSVPAIQKKHILHKVRNIAQFAYRNIGFYNDLYKQAGVNPSKLNCFDDIRLLPVINKQQLQLVDLEERSCKSKNGYLLNTGGSSGQPLTFYMERASHPHELAHMHHMWDKIGYRPMDVKVLFSGRSSVFNTIEYDSIGNQLIVDVYKSWEQIADNLYKIFDKFQPKYLHGYPSAIFDFIFWLDANHHGLLSLLKTNIHGMMLGSEAPNNIARQSIERLINCHSISWYGQSERVILAYEKDLFGRYYPFHSYGFAETALCKENEHCLLGTTYNNFASPLIRYDTGDRVTPVIVEDMLYSFEVSQGREGEFILDSGLNKIFLTALIFGRHHKLLDYCKHLQVRQNTPGKAEIIIVPRRRDILNSTPIETYFDNANVNIDFTFVFEEEPFRTAAQKVPLLIK